LDPLARDEAINAGEWSKRETVVLYQIENAIMRARSMKLPFSPELDESKLAPVLT
jgi:hypothetical protein